MKKPAGSEKTKCVEFHVDPVLLHVIPSFVQDRQRDRGTAAKSILGIRLVER